MNNSISNKEYDWFLYGNELEKIILVLTNDVNKINKLKDILNNLIINKNCTLDDALKIIVDRLNKGDLLIKKIITEDQIKRLYKLNKKYKWI